MSELFLVATIVGFHNNKCYIFFLNNVILNKQNISLVYLEGKIGDRLLIKCVENNFTIIINYGNYLDSSKDLNIFLDLNKFNQTSNINTNIYTKNKALYTKPYRDLSSLKYCTFNIDPEHSTDFDDAISFDINTNIIYIHIVDIHSQIHINSELDLNAILQSYTLYLPGLKKNMLPNEYADDKLSLIKDKTKNVITIEFNLNSDKYEIYQSTIIINKKYNYVNSLPINLDKQEDICLVKLYELTKDKLSEKSSLYIPFINYIIDSNGKLEHLEKETNGNSISHKLIEFLMIITNCIISKHLKKFSLQRFHSSPKNKLVKFNNNSNSLDNQLLDSFMTIIQYKQANYSINESGHYGLDLTSYTHFTSPIRRYFDIINHRILAGIQYDPIFLETLVNYINSREQMIDKLVFLYKKIKLYNSTFLSLKKYNCFITNIVNSGISYLIPELMLSGFIHVTNILPIKKQRWIFDKEQSILTNIDKTIVLTKSQSVLIEITNINQLKLEVTAKIIEIN